MHIKIQNVFISSSISCIIEHQLPNHVQVQQKFIYIFLYYLHTIGVILIKPVESKCKNEYWFLN